MVNFVNDYWRMRLETLGDRLEKNNFQVAIVPSAIEAANYILVKLVPELMPNSVAYGGSMTLASTGILDKLAALEGIELIPLKPSGISHEEQMKLKRRSLLVDLYLTGTNAVTEDGRLVNLDRIGNRVAALTFGPKRVLVVVGRNKIVPDLDSAMHRIKDYAAPANALRLNCKTPCVKTAECADCNSPGRICNTWTITEKSFPKGRVTVILVNDELGL